MSSLEHHARAVERFALGIEPSHLIVGRRLRLNVGLDFRRRHALVGSQIISDSLHVRIAYTHRGDRRIRIGPERLPFLIGQRPPRRHDLHAVVHVGDGGLRVLIVGRLRAALPLLNGVLKPQPQRSALVRPHGVEDRSGLPGRRRAIVTRRTRAGNRDAAPFAHHVGKRTIRVVLDAAGAGRPFALRRREVRVRAFGARVAQADEGEGLSAARRRTGRADLTHQPLIALGDRMDPIGPNHAGVKRLEARARRLGGLFDLRVERRELRPDAENDRIVALRFRSRDLLLNVCRGVQGRRVGGAG